MVPCHLVGTCPKLGIKLHSLKKNTKVGEPRSKGKIQMS